MVRDSDGNEYSTFREQIGEADSVHRAGDGEVALRAKGSRARIEYHEQQRGQYTNVYLDAIEPLGGDGAGVDQDDTDPEEAGWRTAVEAAPWLVGDAGPEDEVQPEELFEKLKPFKDRVAEDIREQDAADDEA